MLPRKNRLKKREDFLRVNQEGSFFSFGGLAIKVLNGRRKETCIGVLVGKKAIKNAAERNKIKRKIRNAINDQIKEIKPGLEAVIYYRPPKGKAKSDIREEIKRLLEKSRLIKKTK